MGRATGAWRQRYCGGGEMKPKETKEQFLERHQMIGRPAADLLWAFDGIGDLLNEPFLKAKKPRKKRRKK